MSSRLTFAIPSNRVLVFTMTVTGLARSTISSFR